MTGRLDLVTLDDGHRVASRCYEAYMEMINACKAAGYSPVNCSSYRAQETQQSLYGQQGAAAHQQRHE